MPFEIEDDEMNILILGCDAALRQGGVQNFQLVKKILDRLPKKEEEEKQ